MSGNKNLYGLHSFNNFKDAWKFMCNFGTDGMDLQILNDNNFPSAVMEQIIIRLVEFRIGKIPREEIETNFGMNRDCMDTYLTAFNFVLYSQKNDKFYASVVETDKNFHLGELSEKEKEIFAELYSAYDFDDLIKRSADFVESMTSLFEQYDKELMNRILEAYWNNEPDR